MRTQREPYKHLFAKFTKFHREIRDYQIERQYLEPTRNLRYLIVRTSSHFVRSNYYPITSVPILVNAKYQLYLLTISKIGH